jgi:iron complex outermembrane receptor protein
MQDTQRVVYLTIGGLPSSFTTNVPDAEVKGVEVDMEYQLTNWLTLGGSGSFTDGKYTDGKVTLFGQSLTFDTFQDTSKWTGSAFAEVGLPVPAKLGSMSLRADVYVQTEQFFSSLYKSLAPDTRLDGYHLVNVRYDWHDILGSKASVAMYVKNLLNREIQMGGFAIGPTQGYNLIIPGPPRTFTAELSYKF